MNSTAKDIVTIINAESSLSLDAASNLVFGQLPNNDDNIVVVQDNPGSPPQLTLQKNTSNYYYSSVSVLVRNKDYNVGYQLAFDIMEFLHGESGQTVGTTLYTLIRATGDPQLLHYDKNDRPIFLINFEVQRRAS